MRILYILGALLFSSIVLAQSGENYRLGPGDSIEIKVYGEEELDLNTQLTDSGIINYPFLGALRLSGLTLKEVEVLIHDGLKGDYLINPNVYVGIVAYRPFYIHGEVKKPGAYPYQPGMTVNQAVALAGGLTERASKEGVNLSREGNKSQQETGTLNSRVFAGDTITIQQRFF
ncbi:polysaccharide export protein [Bowmanella sp. Y26]|uniref:polysaccharide biosynthesis/export family protein n=1 Tax=Bowmanella yangjiangensis TaxID=2811230 RepID=UPI001BDDB540|nr:polysaccharide biosynthesis/export family protein [Bowmanella yangjiangensis]MBT1064566.1 polysaccharide export protein [Bowmanella yangjiangensis]